MVLRRTIEGGGDDLTLDRALHVGDLFGALVDEHHHDVDLGVVLGDRLRDGLQDERLAGLRRRDDEAALTLADRRDEVDDARRELLGRRLEAQALVRVDGRELAEVDAVRGLVDGLAVDRVDLHDRVVLLASALLVAVARLADGADDGVALAQVVLLDLAERDVDVARAGQVAGRAHEGVVVEHVEDARDGDQHVVVGDLGLDLVDRAAPTTVAVAVAVAPATSLALALLLLGGAVLATLAALAVLALAALTLVLALGGLLGVLLLTVLTVLATTAAAAVAVAATRGLTLGLALGLGLLGGGNEHPRAPSCRAGS